MQQQNIDEARRFAAFKASQSSERERVTALRKTQQEQERTKRLTQDYNRKRELERGTKGGECGYAQQIFGMLPNEVMYKQVGGYMAKLAEKMKGAKENLAGLRKHQYALMKELGMTLLPPEVELRKHPQLAATIRHVAYNEKEYGSMEFRFSMLAICRRHLAVILGIREFVPDVQHPSAAQKTYATPPGGLYKGGEIKGDTIDLGQKQMLRRTSSPKPGAGTHPPAPKGSGFSF